MKVARTILLITAAMLIVNLFSGCEESQTTQKPDEQIVKQQAPADAETPKQKPKPAPEPAPDTKPQKNQPKLEFENTIHDFGLTGPGRYLSCQFKFKNTGDVLLKIRKKVDSTCGCTVPILGKTDYAPGESGVIKVRFHTPSTAVTTAKQLYVHSNDPRNSKIPLTIKSTVKLDIEVSPKTLSLNLRDENAGIGPITITSKDGQEFAIKSVVSPRAAITAIVDPTVKATQFTIQPKVDLTKLSTIPNSVITITLDHPYTKTVRVNYTAKPAFTISPSRIIIQRAKAGQKVNKTVFIQSNYNEAVEIAALTIQNQYIKVIKREKLDDGRIQLDIEVTVPAQTTKSRRYFTDELKIHLKNAKALTVRCNGWYDTARPKPRRIQTTPKKK